MDGPDFLVMGSGEGSGGNGRPTSVASFFFVYAGGYCAM